MKKIFFPVLLLAGMVAFGQNKITAIKAGKLVDTENGKLLSNQVILIENDTIREPA
jgi:hypothetical protein